MASVSFKIIPEEKLIFENGRPPLCDGTFGKVVAARIENGLVAVKSCLPTQQRGLTAVEKKMLETEILELSKLTHPNIVTPIGVCYHTDFTISIVEELADGGDLVDFITSVGSHRLTTQHILKLSLDIARGLAFMHSKSVTHNDLKSTNVLICKGTAVLTDFGLAHACKFGHVRILRGWWSWWCT
jgi:serine/threonine protein kinase